MDKAVIAQTVADEIRAAKDCMAAAMNNLTGGYGKAYGRCVSDLYYACYHLARALLSSRGIAAGSLVWTHLQRQYRRNLFSKSPLRRVAALGYLRARPTVNTAQILREYVAWEPRSILRQRGAQMLKRIEATF